MQDNLREAIDTINGAKRDVMEMTRDEFDEFATAVATILSAA